MAAGQATLIVAATDQALPLLRRKPQVDRHTIDVAGDQVPGQTRVGDGVVEGVQHRPVRAGCSSSSVRTKANIVERSRRKWRSTSGM